MLRSSKFGLAFIFALNLLGLNTVSYNPLMEDHLAEIMWVVAKEAEAYEPFAAETLPVIEETKIAATEKQPSERAVCAVLVKETGKDFAEFFESIMRIHVLHQQARFKYSLYQRADASEFQSREQPPLQDRPDVTRLIEELARYGVSPYMLGRLRVWMYKFIARLIVEANQQLTLLQRRANEFSSALRILKAKSVGFGLSHRPPGKRAVTEWARRHFGLIAPNPRALRRLSDRQLHQPLILITPRSRRKT